ncbi:MULTISPECIES: acyltransferase [Bacteroides]|uniref:acyltransferase n=1 Tax=Bacteroides TaxID=816 RepID=UPI00319DFA4D
MDSKESSTLNIVRFIMSIGIVFLHAYTTVQTYPFLKDLQVYQQVTRVCSMQFGELGVPTFFVISGYLFFYGYKQTWSCYKYKMEKRFYSLLIPYLFWNGLMIGIYYAAECIPPIRDLFNDGKKLVHDFDFIDFLRAFWARKNGGPILDQLWFMRNLILLALSSPIIYLFVRYTKIVGLLILGVIWMFSAGMAQTQSSIFYFSLGAWFSINGKSITEDIHKIAKPLFVIFPIIIIADALLDGMKIGLYLHRIQIFTGVLFILALIPVLLEKGKIRDIAFLSSSSFFLYITHDPLLRFLRKFSLRLVDRTCEFQIIAIYFVSIAIDILIVYITYWILQRYAPIFLKWTTGR